MSKKILVPKGMATAGRLAFGEFYGFRDPKELHGGAVEFVLQEALRWLSDNPIVPTPKQIEDMVRSWHGKCDVSDFVVLVMHEWQRRMFLTPELEVPEAVEDLMWGSGKANEDDDRCHNEDVIEAYRRGQQSKEK
jgi:hypothetical protein